MDGLAGTMAVMSRPAAKCGLRTLADDVRPHRSGRPCVHIGQSHVPLGREQEYPMTEHLRVDRIACTAHGLCVVLLPELIQLDEWATRYSPRDCVPRRRRPAAPAQPLALRLATP